MSQVRGRSRLKALDGLRGIAVLAVVVYHYGWRAIELYPQLGHKLVLVQYGQYGVQLFFVISGFVIFMSLEKSSLVKFSISRFIRLYPVYWVCLSLTFLAVTFIGLPGREVSVVEALVNLTMFQSYFQVPNVDGAYWTLAAELAFYIQVALLYKWGLLNQRRITATLYAWMILSAGFVVIARVAASSPLGGALNSLSQGTYWIPLFVTGIAFYLGWSGSQSLMVRAIPIVAIAVFLVRGVQDSVAVAVVCGLVWAALKFPRLGFNSRGLVFLGTISYALYLLHQNLGYICLRFLDGTGVPQPIAVAITLIAAVCLAALVTFGFDNPVRRYLRLRLDRIVVRRSQPSPKTS